MFFVAGRKIRPTSNVFETYKPRARGVGFTLYEKIDRRRVYENRIPFLIIFRIERVCVYTF